MGQFFKFIVKIPAKSKFALTTLRHEHMISITNHLRSTLSSQLQGCGTVGALMGIYLEGIFTTKADIEDDVHAYRHHDISLSSWSQDQALFFTAVITP